MATILRVKRRNNDEPQDALILSKRAKLADDANEAVDPGLVHTFAQFAGTLANRDENIVQHLAKTSVKAKLEANFKKPALTNISALMHAHTTARSKAQRYKVVNYQRSVDTSSIEKFEENMTVLDVEDSVSLAAKEDDDCVYDLYYLEANDAYIGEYVSILSLAEHELIFETNKEDSDCSDDSEDSNAECHWRNDYPDEYSESTDEDDMRDAMCNESKSWELSSDEDYDENEKYNFM